MVLIRPNRRPVWVFTQRLVYSVSAQYRMIEFASTELINLIDFRFRETIDRDTPFIHAYEHLYWQAAGKDYETGEKSTLLTLFEERYTLDQFYAAL